MGSDGRAVEYCVDATTQYGVWIPGELNRLNRKHKGRYKTENCPNEHADKDHTITARPLVALYFIFVSQVNCRLTGDNN